MLRTRLHVAAIALALAFGASACVSNRQPALKVLSVEQSARPARDMVLYVEVTNPAARPLRLQRLQYSFQSSAKVAGVAPVVGEVILSRTVDAGAAVVVEVPLSLDHALPTGEEMTLAGRLYATQDELQRSFAVSAKIDAL
jgi:hypothetical protein